MGSLPFQVQGRDSFLAESAMTVCGCIGQPPNVATSGNACGGAANTITDVGLGTTALLIHAERKRMYTAISTLAHSTAPAAPRLKPLRVHVRTIIYDNSKEVSGHRQIARILR